MGSSALNEKPDEEEDRSKGYVPQYAVTGQGLHYRLAIEEGEEGAGGWVGWVMQAQVSHHWSMFAGSARTLPAASCAHTFHTQLYTQQLNPVAPPLIHSVAPCPAVVEEHVQEETAAA